MSLAKLYMNKWQIIVQYIMPHYFHGHQFALTSSITQCFIHVPIHATLSWHRNLRRFTFAVNDQRCRKNQEVITYCISSKRHYKCQG
ncbi:hypothetical protein GDO81_025850 [Engystomops pustulosus]|uniref:Uncharacterized protein n=1 Tax=Engystomops pustulosus TaxID=76066 RepID=A0AAV6YSE9_ENGPU|nr:hypothetical protein GDO81_025850 [Engystomops pustulosus]